MKIKTTNRRYTKKRTASIKKILLETNVHQQVVKYLKFQYPKILFRTDFAAGMHMSIGQAVKHKKIQQGRAWPDLFIAHPAAGYHGLFLEIKRDFGEIANKNGTMKKSVHLKEQLEIITNLNQHGYKALFACGFDQAKKEIDDYLFAEPKINPVISYNETVSDRPVQSV